MFYGKNVTDSSLRFLKHDMQSKSKVQLFYIVRPKVDQRAGLLSLPHLGIFAIHPR